jgi:hypothetical protein
MAPANLLLELSYLLQYVEENGRNHGDPWSLRQTGVYQQANIENRRSAWIFLQLPRSVRHRLETILRRSEVSTIGSLMRFHGVLLLDTVENWGKYIEYIHSQLRVVVRDNVF